jgi:flagellar M-ring protein FliF
LSQIGVLWSALGLRQRLIAGLAFVAVVAAVVGLVQAARQPAMTTLYSGLEAAAAGEVATAVESMGVPVEIRGSTILVPVQERDRVRLQLAADGLPKAGPAGYELLENMDGFGTTSEMFEASYWRAKEGELARTILAAPGVRAARVHIANPAGRPFQRGAEPSASVTVTTTGGPLPQDMAEAIRYMVSSAVAGLSPTSVSVIDAAHGAILRQGESASDVAGGAGGPAATREKQLRSEVERLLAARVGEGKAIVTVSVDVASESERVVERVIDPDSRVVISSDVRESTDNSTGSAGGGGATVASNLPQAAAGPGGEPPTRQRADTEERINFEVSEKTREITRPAGEVQRVTVAVLVDGIVSYDGSGARQWQPRPQDELDRIRQLVESSIGFNADRGDVVTVEMLEFADKPGVGVVAESGLMRFLEANAVNLIQMAILGGVALGLALFVLRPLMRAAEQQAAAPIVEDGYNAPMLEWPSGSKMNPSIEEEVSDDSLSLLKNTFSERRDESATVLRGWLEAEPLGKGDERGAA